MRSSASRSARHVAIDRRAARRASALRRGHRLAFANARRARGRVGARHQRALRRAFRDHQRLETRTGAFGDLEGECGELEGDPEHGSPPVASGDGDGSCTSGGPRRLGMRTFSAPSPPATTTRRCEGVECLSASGGAEQHRHGAPGLGRHLQAAQPRVFLRDALHPEQHRAARARLERLLRGPERIFARGGTHHEAALERDAGLRERRRIGQVRRIDPRDEALVPRARAPARRRATSPRRCRRCRAALPRACLAASRRRAARASRRGVARGHHRDARPARARRRARRRATARSCATVALMSQRRGVRGCG